MRRGPMPTTHPLPSRGRPWRLVVIAVFVGLAALVGLALALGNPFPPRTIIMATGPDGSAFSEFGVRYREILARSGVHVELTATEGGATNLARLRDARLGVVVGFVEGGLASGEQSPGLATLGTVTIEPLWLFLRGDGRTPVGNPAQLLGGKRIAVEPAGSGGAFLTRRLLALNGLDDKRVRLLELTPERGADALLRGEVDGITMLTAVESPAMRRLLAANDVRLEGFPRADAYVARSPYLYKLVLPTGVADLARNIPPADVPMLAVAASLVVREDLHPALQYLLLEAAAEIHGGPGVFHRPGRFPAAEAIDMPLSKHAEAFYRSGRPFIYSILPFWLAGSVERLLIVLIPLFAIVLPVAHFLPTVLANMTERKIFRLYGELKLLESELAALRPDESVDEIVAALDKLAARAGRLRVGIRYQQRRFILKDHITEVQQAAERHRAALVVEPPTVGVP